MGLVEGLQDMKTTAETLGVVVRDVAPICDITGELRMAVEKKGAFASRHEALGVLYEEFDEFADAIRADDHDGALLEAKQISAVMMRFYLEFRGKA